MQLLHVLPGNRDEPAAPLALTQNAFDENWLQEVLFRAPSVLPVDEIEPGYGSLAPLCREMSTPSGFVDNVFVNHRGQIVLVECKLWRNAEARRKVVAQILDYAKDLTSWGISELALYAHAANKQLPTDIYELVAKHPEALGPTLWADAVSRNLRLGKMLLLIVGDGIREETANLAAFLQSYAHLSFTLGLVEMPVSKHGEDWILAPRIALKTQIINRVLVQYGALEAEKEAEETEAPEGVDTELALQQQTNVAFWTQYRDAIPEVAEALAQPLRPVKGQTIWLSIFPSPMPAWIGAFTSKGLTGGGVYAAFPGPKSDLFGLGRRMYDIILGQKNDVEKALGGVQLEWLIRAEQPSIIWRLPAAAGRSADETCAELAKRTKLFMKVMRPALFNARQEAEVTA